MRNEEEVRLMMGHMRRLMATSPRGDGFGKMDRSTFAGMGMMLDGLAWACGEPNEHLDRLVRMERGDITAAEEIAVEQVMLRALKYQEDRMATETGERVRDLLFNRRDTRKGAD